MKGLAGQVVVVAGGGRGIGRAVAEKFAEYGAYVVVGSRTVAEIEETVARIRNEGGQAWGRFLDVTDRCSVAEFVEWVCTVYGRIDVLVYCAGVNTRMPAEEYPEDAWERVMDTNVTGAYRMCQEVGRRMIQHGGGAIVNITSMMSHVTTPYQGAYAAAKGGLLQYTKVLAVEWAKHNIRVNAVSPGYIRTELTAEVLEQTDFRENIVRKTPQGRLGLPEEIAEAVCFLASPAASFITGIALPVDGGFLAGHPQIVPNLPVQ
jgi:NAD(P)-dependent dehydrogenase (short-subunit alcohol dehydrogenase family)